MPQGTSPGSHAVAGHEWIGCDNDAQRAHCGAGTALMRNSVKPVHCFARRERGIFAALEHCVHVESSHPRAISSLPLQGFSHISSRQLG
jgi:hypothetical protein